MRRFSSLLLACCFGFAFPATRVGAQIELFGPTGSGEFGESVTVLPNGNFVVTDPLYDLPGIGNVGAVYLYHGVTLALISKLTGGKSSDQVGNGGITVLSNGNFVIYSTLWDNGSAANCAAVTWGSATTGVTGIVSAANSLIGSASSDQIGGGGIIPLPNGNYVVSSPVWNNGAMSDVGAVTWGSGTIGLTGLVSAANSLIGTTALDEVGNAGITVLTDGNFVVRSTTWDNGPIVNAGAVTWGSGTIGVTGIVSAANSLVGGLANDQIGNSGITELNGGNYVVRSTSWDNGAEVNAGAVTWGSGTTGVVGLVSAANSLVGSTANDQVGISGITVLNNGNYVVRSLSWDRGTLVNAGAVTWGSGTNGVSGEVSAANSLIGTAANDQIGNSGVIALNNGNYVVVSSSWDNGALANAGAVTWGNGATGVSSEISAANSLVGIAANDSVGSSGVEALTNGNYVVCSPNWDNGAVTNAGAVTWCSGVTGISGAVSAFNSLIGTTANDQVGSSGLIVLGNGHYVVISPSWDNGAVGNAGAVTWGSGTNGIIGTVSPANSLVGGTANDQIGSGGVIALNNGNYIVNSPLYDNGAFVNAGAVTWGNGDVGTSGVVSSANSLVGSSANDQVGNNGVFLLRNGNYVVTTPHWKNGAVENAGAVTWGNGTNGVNGAVSAANSLVGTTTNDTVGNYGVCALSNGNYVVISLSWDNGAVVNAGAVTWGSGTSGATGAVSPANSLVGSTANDLVGYGSVIALTNGNYVVSTPLWDNGAAVDAGAVTWGNGATGLSGVVSVANSLVGETTGDALGNAGVTALNDGNYVVSSPLWDRAVTNDAGATSLGNGLTGTIGPITAANSVRGTATNGGDSMNFTYDMRTARLFVGYPAGNRVSIIGYAVVLLSLPYHTNGAFRFTVFGPTGPNYVIMTSSDLVNWTDLATNISPAVPFQFTDPASLTDRRFYRARLQL